MKKINGYTYATGRKKEATSRVFLKTGSGKFLINNIPAEEFAKTAENAYKLFYPLNLLKVKDKYDIKATVKGGGFSSQCDAVKFGVAYVLSQELEDYRNILKANKLLSRDTRKVERKKPGLKKARKAPQFSKR